MSSIRKRLERRLGSWALRRAQAWLLRKRPEDAERTGAFLGRLMYRVARTRRRRCLSNLELAMPELSAPERLAVGRRVFEHYGIVAADFLTGARRTPEEFDASMEVEGVEHLEEGLAAGRGVLIVTGHFGNWERIAVWLSTHGYPLSVVARDTGDPGLDGLVKSLRGGPGTRVIARGDAARPILERLRKNELIGILPDQNAQEIFVPFFGKPAGTVLGPGVIAERTGCAVVPTWCARTGPGRYRMFFEPPLLPEPGCQQRGEGMTRAINAALERVIRRYPDQWLWFHDRWRSARRQGLL
jgi:KDO2-lipid IV(A) lauroyltransferase